MPIESTHPLYDKHQEQWRRCRDVVAGSDEVKARGEVYLPKMKGWKPDDYEAYKKRALFYGATGRSVQGMTGAVWRKAPRIEVPEKLAHLLNDATGTGVPLSELIKFATREAIKTGRIGILVERPADGGDLYLTTYCAEKIKNWGDGFYVLEECTLQGSAEDRFALKNEESLRELSLDENGIYHQQVWKKRVTDGKSVWVVEATLSPNRMGKPLNAIPFVVINAGGSLSESQVDKPPILDLVDVNLSHYRSSADLEHGRHYTALPTPYVTGVSDPKATLSIGSLAAWQLPDANSKAGFLEFTGQGLAALDSALEQKQEMMAVLGARMLTSKRTGVEAAETARIHQAGESASLADIVTAIEFGFEKALSIAAEWEGLSQEVIEVELNRDFVDQGLTAQEITSLVGAWQAGILTDEQALWNLKQGERLMPGTDLEEEASKLVDKRDTLAVPAPGTMS